MTKLSVHQRKARDFIQREDWGNALSELQRMLGADGENPTLHNQIGDVYLRKEDVAHACEHFERAIDLYAQVGLHNNAVALCKKIMRLRPHRFEIRYRLARLRLDQGFRTEAALFFADYLEHSPSDGESIDRLEKACREMVDLLPDDAPLGKMLEKLENASRFTTAFELVRKLAQRAADAGDEVAAARFAEKMRSLRILVERSGGRDLLAELGAKAPEPSPAHLEPEPPVAVLGPAPEATPATGAAPEEASPAAGAEEPPPAVGAAFDALRAALEPNQMPAERPAEAVEPPAVPELSAPAAPAREPSFAAGSMLDFGLVDLPPRSREPIEAAAAAAVVPEFTATTASEAIPIDSRPPLPEFVEENPPAPEYELPDTSFADLAHDLGSNTLAPQLVPPLGDAPPLDETAGEEVRAAAGRLDTAPDALGVDPRPPVGPAPAPEMRPAPAPAPSALRDIPVWIPEDEAPLPTSALPADAVTQLDLESVIDSFREQMARTLDGDGVARYDLGVAYFDMGLYNEALAEFEAASRCPGLEVQSYEMVAACLLATGRHAEVIELLVPVLAADGHAPRGRLGLQYSLGLAFDAIGDTEQARRCFEEVALVDIEFKDVQVRLQRL